MEFVPSRRGRDMLSFEGFLYRMDRKHPSANSSTWRCQQRQCQGRAKLVDNQVILVTPHNHTPSFKDIEAKKAIASILDKAKTLPKPPEGLDQFNHVMAEFPQLHPLPKPLLQHIQGYHQQQNLILEEPLPSEGEGGGGSSDADGVSGGFTQALRSEKSLDLSDVREPMSRPVTFIWEGSSNEDRSGDGASTTEESMLGPDLMAPPETEQAVSPNPTTPGQQKPESYQLRHNNHMTLVLESLAQDEAFMDVTLTAQGRSIRAHKSVLSAVSPYFRGVLCENPCQHPIIIMPRDVRFDELQSIITYIYKGEMTVAAEDLSSLLKTAEILQVTGLTPADPQAASAAAAASFNPQISSTFTSPETPRTSNTKTYQTQQKSQDSINPTDFMDMDMTCVKEEVMSGDEDGDEDEQDSASYPPSQFTPHSQGNEPQPTTTNQTSSSSSMTTTTPSAQTRYSSDADVNPDPCTSPSKDEEDLISCQVPMSREDPEPFVCPHCKEIARGFEALTLHLKTKHPSKLSFPCRCGRVYLRHGRYVDHTKFCNTGSS